MKRILIDSDTASDDAIAIILALRDPQTTVEAITVVAGNVPLETAVKNALISVQVADTYQPPVYPGMAKPMLRDLFTSEFVHGLGGMGGMDLPALAISPEPEHAVDALMRIIEGNPHQLELVTLGPLTNIAMLCLKAPETVKKLQRITIMGGAGLGPGNITPVAEFNVYVDAEALQIVLDCGVPILLVGWDASMGTAFLDEQDLRQLMDSGGEIARFCVECHRGVQEFNLNSFGIRGVDLPDPATIAVAIHPDMMLETLDAFAAVEFKSERTYGQVIIDTMGLLAKPANVQVCKSLDGAKFKQYLCETLVEQAQA